MRITHDTGDDDGDDMTMNVRPRVGGSNEEPSAVQYVITRASNEPSRRLPDFYKHWFKAHTSSYVNTNKTLC